MIQDIAFFVMHPVTDKEIEWKELVSDPLISAEWTHSTSNELGKMAQSVRKMQMSHSKQKEQVQHSSFHPKVRHAPV